MDLDAPSLLADGANDTSVWTEVFTVRAFEAGPAGTLTIQNLCNYFQEAAGNHAHALGVSVAQLSKKKLTWMLSRLHVKVERYPAWRDTVFIDTWPSGHNGLFATREFKVYTEAGDQVARGTSAWLLIDLLRRRPIRMPDFIDQLVLPDLPRAIADPFLRIKPLESTTIQRHFEVRFSDLDLNKHANNVSILNWALESVPVEIHRQHRVSSLEVFFKAEARQGEAILAKGRKDPHENGFKLHHVLYNTSDASAKEIATVKTRWV